jgi:hypothetical protein
LDLDGSKREQEVFLEEERMERERQRDGNGGVHI